MAPYQAPLSLGFSRQEYWRGLPFPSPGHLPYPGIKPTSPISPALAGRFFTTSAIWEAQSPYTEHGRAELDSPCLSDVSVGVANIWLILQHLSEPSPPSRPSTASLASNACSLREGLPWWSNAWESALAMQEVWVQSLVGEPKSHMPRGAAKNV